MGKSQETFNKKEKEKKRLKKSQEKQQRREERKLKPKGGFESMMAYVDENGNISDTPPDPLKKKKINPKNPVVNNVLDYLNERLRSDDE